MSFLEICEEYDIWDYKFGFGDVEYENIVKYPRRDLQRDLQ